MNTGLWRWLAVGWLLWPAGAVAAEAEIVVAIRYLQRTGTSHSHLYLYREDGKLLRQLTNDDKAQDTDPIFAPDGETIVFARELPANVKRYWSIEPHGGNLRQITAPDWYAQIHTPPSFNKNCGGSFIEPGQGPNCIVTCKFPGADGETEITITPTPPADADAPDHWDVHLRADDGTPAKVGELPGYSAEFLSLQKDEPTQSRLHEGTLDVVFLYNHLNSTDGDTVSALDLNQRRVVRISPNWADVIALPSEAAFLTLTENRYVSFGDGTHTANCSYLEHWDAGLKALRYAEGKAAAICCGASIYRPDKTPTTVTIRRRGVGW